MKKILITSIIILTLIGGIGYQLYRNQQESLSIVSQEKESIPFTIEAITIKEKQFVDSTYYLGEISPLSITTIATETHGKIAKVNFKKGDKVAKNQILAQLDNTILNASVAIQKANASKLKKDVDRLKQLFEEKNATTSELENLQTQLTTATEQLKIAEKELSHAIIRSPANAIVVEKFANEGEVLAAGSQISTLADVSSVLAKIQLKESDALRLKTGDKLNLKLKSYPNKIFVGEIESIIPIATETKLYPTEIKIKNNNPKFPLLAGMQIEIEIKFNKGKKSLAIPRTSIAGSYSNPHVFKIAKGKILKTKITLGAIHENLIEVANGINPNDTIATLGISNLEDGMIAPKYKLAAY